jgi:DNA invertase Pin-like site-specific DNA recombinase
MSNMPMELWRVYMYLRKSRKDENHINEPIEVTLAKHRDLLNRIASRYNLNVVKVYEEVKSGDSISARPFMLELLADIEDGLVDAVLVIDIDRLGRGDLQDQGYILNLFKRKGVRIITPNKIYDLDDEVDEDMFDFNAFFARKELTTIKRRFARGKLTSLNNGKYISAKAPYGYRKENKTLVVVEEQAEVVRLIFDLYVNHGYGDTKIARYLSEHGYKNYSGNQWERTTLRRMINNPVYIGKISWNKRKDSSSGMKNRGGLKPAEEWTLYDSPHQPIIDEETFWKAQALAKERIVPHGYSNNLSNPLSYIMKCGACGYTMSQRVSRSKRPTIRCHRHCGGVMSTYIECVEERLIAQLRDMLETLRWEYNQTSPQTKMGEELDRLAQVIVSANKEIEKLKAKRRKQYDLLEEGVYTSADFIERNKLVTGEMERQHEIIRMADEKSKELRDKIKTSENVLPRIVSATKFIDEVYWELDAAHKNDFLRTIVDHVVYYKPKGSEQLDFKLEVFLKL